jgi:hypothetical protein
MYALFSLRLSSSHLTFVLLFTDVIGRIIAVTDIVVVHSQYQAEPSDTRTVVLQDQA